MSENVIFCYSGTGNCLDMAKTIARELGDTDIILMRKEPAVTDVRDAKRVGFVFPCYGGGLPGGVEESLRKIQVASRRIRSASASTRATWLRPVQAQQHHPPALLDGRVAPVHVHLAAAAQRDAAAGDARHGAAPRGQKGKQIAQAVLSGAVSPKAPPKKPVNQLESSVWPKIVAGKAQKFAVSDACVACGQCARLCPRGNIRIEGGRAVRKLIADGVLSDKDMVAYLSGGKKGTHTSFLEINQVGDVLDSEDEYVLPNRNRYL